MTIRELLEFSQLPEDAGQLLKPEALPPEEERRILARILEKADLPHVEQKEEPKMKKKSVRLLLLAAVLCAGAVVASAVGYFTMDKSLAKELGLSSEQAQEMLEKSGNVIQASQEKEGWTLTVNQAVGDRNCAYLLLELTAPEGTVLDADTYLLNCMPTFDRLPGGGWSVDLLEDEDPADNRLTFLMDLSFNCDMRSAKGVLQADRLEAIHSSENHQNDRIEPLEVPTWNIPFRLDFEDTLITYQPDRTAETTQGPIQVGKVELPPLSITMELSGEAAKGKLDPVSAGAAAQPGAVQLEILDKGGNPIPTGMFRGAVAYGLSDSQTEGDAVRKVLLTFQHAVNPAEVAAIVIDGVEIPLK